MTRLCFVLGVMVFLAPIDQNAQQNHFERIETFPEGSNTSAVGSLISPAERHTAFEFDSPLSKVWRAAKQASTDPALVEFRPILYVDEELHTIQNGSLSRKALDPKVRGGDLVDEFHTQVIGVSESRTRVVITRKVERQIRGRWGYEKSNGKIERWMLSRIEDSLKQE